MRASTIASNGHLSTALPALGLTPEAAARSRTRRVNIRLVAGAVCILGAFVGFLLFVASATPRTQGVVVATRELPAGTRLRRTDVAVVQAQLGSAQARTVIGAEALDDLEGQQLLAPTAAQQMIARAQVATGTHPVLQPGQVRMSLSVKPETAVGGALHSGDLVTVLATRDKGKATAETRAVLERAMVDEIGLSNGLATSSAPTNGPSQAGPSGSISSRAIAWVTLVVPEDRATAVSLARWSGDIELIQLPAGSAANTRAK
jgi:Flp pilus assembly protein CpaB